MLTSPRRLLLSVAVWTLATCAIAEPRALPQENIDARRVYAPVILASRQSGVVLLPDGTLKRFVSEGLGDGLFRNYSVTSPDGVTWGGRTFEFEGLRANLPLLDKDGEYHLFPMVVRQPEETRKIAVNYFIDVWHVRTREDGTKWEPAQRIFEGYVGSLNNVSQLSNGRIIVPFAKWIGGRKTSPPTGANEVICVYSDDGGATWRESPGGLTAPAYTDFNGSGYGACEPVIIELTDGRVYMLARTETGVLYESWSPDGVNWEPLKPSRFLSTDAPAAFLRLPDKRILLFWNGCEKPQRVNGDGVYGGRDAVHAAISSDECKTWKGFREIYRDPSRNQTPPATGDRGTAYPMPYLGAKGKVIVLAGQGRAGATLLFDPDWLEETHHASDFSDGVMTWSVFKHFGPAKRWWRDRAQGAVVINHPDAPDAKVLHLRRPDEKPGDGGVWNFPMGRKGDLRMRVKFQAGFQGASITLMDRFFNPTDTTCEKEAIVALKIDEAGKIALRESISLAEWHDLDFQWDLNNRTCVVSVDHTPRVYLKPAYRDPLGINYLRVRSTAEEIDTAGILIESVEVDIEW
jgi:hypothetical protein